MNRDIKRNFFLIVMIVLGAILLSLFFWPEWTDWKIRLGVLIIAISFSTGYRGRQLQKPQLQRIKRTDPYEMERQRLKSWSDSWR